MPKKIYLIAIISVFVLTLFSGGLIQNVQAACGRPNLSMNPTSGAGGSEFEMKVSGVDSCTPNTQVTFYENDPQSGSSAGWCDVSVCGEGLHFTTYTTTTYYAAYDTNRDGTFGANEISAGKKFTVTGPPTAPIITAQPPDQAVAVGDRAFFSIAVDGTKPFTYQWRKNGSNISGATDIYYETPVTTLSDNGNTYGIVVTNSGGEYNERFRNTHG